MKCLLTGATGFFGKRILDLLIADERIEAIHVISRRKTFHVHPKVWMHTGDLTETWNTQDYIEDLDAILHIAGLYQFNAPLSQCYQQNVLPALNLVDQIRQSKTKKKPRVLFASTYVVGLGSNEAIAEGPLTQLPSSSEPYAYTKALAEKVITDSGYPASIFRLGILVGDQSCGHIDKIDGPYYLMKSLYQLSLARFIPGLRALPIPASREGIIPLVPVDSAAQVLHQSLFHEPKSGRQEYFGVYHPESINPYHLGELIYENYFPNRRFFPMGRGIPKVLFKLQTPLTQIPREIIEYSLRPIPLHNPYFQEVFGSHAVPHFEEYREAFFSGFHESFLGQTRSSPGSFK